MSKKKKIAIAVGVIVLAVIVAFLVSPTLQFVAGGALVNMGYRMQDHIGAYDLAEDDTSPAAIWAEVQRQNELSASVRDRFPRTSHHPVIALLVCMDARIDTSELMGDTRRYYYIVRTAGSALAEPEQEMLELAVVNGVKVIVITSHTDCAAEAAAADPELRARFPAMVTLVDQREERIREFMARPVIRDALANGSLRIERARINTDDDRLEPEQALHHAHL